jgi:hypothetical protein
MRLKLTYPDSVNRTNAYATVFRDNGIFEVECNFEDIKLELESLISSGLYPEMNDSAAFKSIIRDAHGVNRYESPETEITSDLGVVLTKASIGGYAPGDRLRSFNN